MIRLTLFLLLIFCSYAQALTKLTATTDKNEATENQELTLIITADDDLDFDSLNIYALDSDFMISSRKILRNGNETKWYISILPRVGKKVVKIPKFTINNISSTEIALPVKKDSSYNKSDLFLKSYSNVKEAYVGQLITYTIEIYIKNDFILTGASLPLPKLDSGDIYQIKKDTESQKIIDNKPYKVFTRVYGVKSDSPGPLTIPSIFKGDFQYSAFSAPKSYQIESEPVVINILPKPSTYQGNWFVADNFFITDSWSDTENVSVGAPITRTMTYNFTNQFVEQFTPPNIDNIKDFKVYSDKPSNKIISDNPLTNKVTIVSSIVPKKAGDFTIPGYKIPWWDPKSKQQKYVEIHEKTIHVKAAENSGIQPNPNIDLLESALKPKVVEISKEASNIPLYIAILEALVILAMFLYILRLQGIKSVSQIMPQNAKKPSMQPIMISINDRGKLLQEIQNYMSMLYKKPITIAEISKYSQELGDIITSMQVQQYSSGEKTSNFDSNRLLELIKNLDPNSETSKVSLSKLNL